MCYKSVKLRLTSQTAQRMINLNFLPFVVEQKRFRKAISSAIFDKIDYDSLIYRCRELLLSAFYLLGFNWKNNAPSIVEEKLEESGILTVSVCRGEMDDDIFIVHSNY